MLTRNPIPLTGCPCTSPAPTAAFSSGHSLALPFAAIGRASFTELPVAGRGTPQRWEDTL